ncbi:MAG: ATP-dependent sacrificial sulfur transferase LarE, partial [Helicobacteraceae bacterium]|nr:ATP-dependent sacrificial sulfur transferase LarE [Helicobacteraceae bacterium]
MAEVYEAGRFGGQFETPPLCARSIAARRGGARFRKYARTYRRAMNEMNAESLALRLSIDEKYERLLVLIAELKSAATAFSGGADSSFLCYAALKALGRNALAVTIVSPMLPKIELESAAVFAKTIGIEHVLIEEREIDEAVAANQKERCYFCKKLEFGSIVREAERRGLNAVLDGSNLDDLDDYRPGLKALEELKIRSPLREAFLGKAEIRALSKRFGLITWDKPAAACLASRIPYGERIDEHKLARIESAEEYLRHIGFRRLRVRSHGEIARIEVGAEERARFFDEKLMDTVSR